MQVAIAGGHGKIALRLARLLHARGDRPLGLIRNPGQAGDVRAAGAEPVTCDLEAADADALARAIEGSHAVVFAAGAGPGSGHHRKWTMDRDGALKLVDAAKAAGISRYVMGSSMGADPGARGEDTFAVYQRAKGEADAALAASGLDHTIVRPGSLTDEPGTGRVRIGERVGRGRVSRDDVAAVLAAVLDEPGTAGAVFELIAGDTPVPEAVAALARR
jgi:uncharacterized protein YbjT (DUF2867 family)